MSREDILDPVTSMSTGRLPISPLSAFTKNFKFPPFSFFFPLKNFFISTGNVGGFAKLIAILGANKVPIKIDCVLKARGGWWFMLML